MIFRSLNIPAIGIKMYLTKQKMVKAKNIKNMVALIAELYLPKYSKVAINK
jgi:hypothetical protein